LAAALHARITIVGIDGADLAPEQASCMPALLHKAHCDVRSHSGDVALKWIFYFEHSDFCLDLCPGPMFVSPKLRTHGLILIASAPANSYEHIHEACLHQNKLDYVDGVVEQTIEPKSFFKMVRGYLEAKAGQSDDDITVVGIGVGPCSTEEADLMPQLLRNARNNLQLHNDKFALHLRWRYYLTFDDFKAELDEWKSKAAQSMEIEDSFPRASAQARHSHWALPPALLVLFAILLVIIGIGCSLYYGRGHTHRTAWFCDQLKVEKICSWTMDSVPGVTYSRLDEQSCRQSCTQQRCDCCQWTWHPTNNHASLHELCTCVHALGTARIRLGRTRKHRSASLCREADPNLPRNDSYSLYGSQDGTGPVHTLLSDGDSSEFKNGTEMI